MRRLFVLLALATLACDSGPAGPDTEPADVIVNAQVNVQLGDTPAGQQPTYIATGEVTATQDGVPVTAIMDSVVIHYRISNGAFVRHTRRNSLPFSDELPFHRHRRPVLPDPGECLGNGHGYRWVRDSY